MSNKKTMFIVILMLCSIITYILYKEIKAENGNNIVNADCININQPIIDAIGQVITEDYEAGDIIQIANSIVDNQSVFGYDTPLPYDWSCKGIESRSVCYCMHGFTFLDPVYGAWVLTKDEKYKDYIEKWIIDWVKNNPTVLEGNEWAWHDDAIARRVFRISLYAYLWKSDFTKSELEIILTSLKGQAQLLSEDSFYKHKQNHGMYQDMGLITYSILLANINDRDKYLSLSENRSREYFDYCFTEDGVHKEHSPHYHIDVSQELLFYRDIFKEYDSDFSTYVENLRNKSMLFTTEIMMPDGTIPSVGDSTRKVLKSIASEDDPYYLYATTGGVKGKMPPNVYVFSKSGYAVMRSSWKDSHENATYLLYTAATFSSTHKHSDDLSFILYHRGDLFVEAGSRNYNYTEQKTKYAYSAYAHNVLLVDGEGFPVHIGQNGFQSITNSALNTHIIDYDINTDDRWVTAVQSRFDNVTQYRTVSYNKVTNVVKVCDELDVKEHVKSSLIYHIAADVRIESTNDGWKLYREEALIANVKVQGSNVKLRTISGSEGETPLNTWIFDGKEDPQIGSLLIVDMDCLTGKNNMDLIITLY